MFLKTKLTNIRMLSIGVSGQIFCLSNESPSFRLLNRTERSFEWLYLQTGLHLHRRGPFLCHPLAISQVIFASDMTIYYCQNLEEALKRAKAAGKRPGCRYCGIVLKNGKSGFAIYKEGIVIEQYSVIGRKKNDYPEGWSFIVKVQRKLDWLICNGTNR